MATAAQSVADVCTAARVASRTLATVDDRTKDAALEAMAAALEDRIGEVLEANARDMEAGAEAGLTAALLDRLKLTDERVRGPIGVRELTTYKYVAEGTGHIRE